MLKDFSDGSTAAMGVAEKRRQLRTKTKPGQNLRLFDGLIFPGEYVAFDIVEQIFKTWKSFYFFMCITKEDDVEARGGSISRLSIPIQEMREHKNRLCKELFCSNSIKGLDTRQRLKLARVLRSRYNSSSKQIARLCGLLYEEVKNL